MTQITTIIFDIGGVIFRAGNGPPLREKWAEKCNLTDDEFDDIVFRDPLYWQASIGKISSIELWERKNKRLKLKPDALEALKQDSWQGDWDSELLNFIKTNLHGKYQLALLSDATSGAREMVGEHVDFSLFETVVFSYEVGMCKPNPDIYHLTLKRLGAKPDETIFIDDGAHKVEGANSVGIHGILYTELPTLKSALAQFLE